MTEGLKPLAYFKDGTNEIYTLYLRATDSKYGESNDSSEYLDVLLFR